MARLTTKEQATLNGYLMYGQSGVEKVGRNWHVDGCPAVFKTKMAAMSQWENYIHALIDRDAGRV